MSFSHTVKALKWYTTQRCATTFYWSMSFVRLIAYRIQTQIVNQWSKTKHQITHSKLDKTPSGLSITTTVYMICLSVEYLTYFIIKKARTVITITNQTTHKNSITEPNTRGKRETKCSGRMSTQHPSWTSLVTFTCTTHRAEYVCE